MPCEVNGENSHPVFRYLRTKTDEKRCNKDPNNIMRVPWNFSKWIVNEKGEVVVYLDPSKSIKIGRQEIIKIIT